MKQFSVTGMSCAACAARVEKAVRTVSGVTECSVSLLTNSMGVEGTASDTAIIRAVVDAGYGASVIRDSDRDELLRDTGTASLRRRLYFGAAFVLILMYVSMGHRMWDFPLPPFLRDNPFYAGILQALLALAVMIINRKFFFSGFKGVLHGAPNMDTLVALGSGASFGWSVYALVMTAKSQFSGDLPAAFHWQSEYYFESAAMILVLITVGKLLEAKSKGRTTDALKALMRLAPDTATVIRDGNEQQIPVAQIAVGDRFVVRPGESIPTDGVIEEGVTAVNESALTGESIPVDKAPGDPVYSATVNQFGFIRCEATHVGEDTALSKIIRMVSDTAAGKAPIAKIADRVSGVFVPVVTAIAVLTLGIWLLCGKTFAFALARAISVLVISCPCALGLATPVAIMVGSGVGAKHGILFKTAESLEQTGKTQIIALDKTGTVTCGTPQVKDIVPSDSVTQEALLSAAYALEAKSEHPLGRAVILEAEQRNLPLSEVSDFRIYPGNGLSAILDGEILLGGSLSFLQTKCTLSADTVRNVQTLSDGGMTPLLFAKGSELLGIIAVADTVREDSAGAVDALRRMGIEPVLLTGDNARTAKAVAQSAHIGHVIAGVLPDEKEAVIRRLQTLGAVAMVGDGINDAPALTAADTGIAIGSGTDVAIDAGDVVLMKGGLSGVPAAIRLSRATLRNIKQNLFWAFFYNALCIPLAAGAYIGLFGWALSPMIGAAAMSLSSVCVVSNALRLNLFSMNSSKHDRIPPRTADRAALSLLVNEINQKTEDRTMKKTIKIEGMMCMHCEAHTKKALEAIDGVESAVASHTEKQAVVTLTKEVADDVLKAAVEGAGYTVLGIE